MKRVVRLLRSRRLAVLLIAGISAWAVVASSIPGWSTSFSSPAFIGASLWLLAATAACAWERSKGATGWRKAVSRRSPLSSPLPLPDVAHRLRSLGLTVTVADDSFIATRRGNAVSVWASPVFHWSLAAGIALAIVGSAVGFRHPVVLTEGVTQRPDLPGRRLTLTLAEVRPVLVVDGIKRGQAPRLVASSPGVPAREEWSYPNHPLRYAGVTVHGVDSGPAVRLRLSDAGGSTVETDVPLTSHTTGGYSGQLAVIDGPALRVTQRPGRRIEIRAMDTPARDSAIVLAEGESESIGDGLTASFVRASTWASVSIVRDPTALWLALAGAVGCVAMAIALLYPARVVWVKVAEKGCTFRIASSRLDPGFSRRVREALGEAETVA